MVFPHHRRAGLHHNGLFTRKSNDPFNSKWDQVIPNYSLAISHFQRVSFSPASIYYHVHSSFYFARKNFVFLKTDTSRLVTSTKRCFNAKPTTTSQTEENFQTFAYNFLHTTLSYRYLSLLKIFLIKYVLRYLLLPLFSFFREIYIVCPIYRDRNLWKLFHLLLNSVSQIDCYQQVQV